MQQPLVIAYHLIWTGYGWWLPNDPRGSGSKAIDSDIIAQLGELHYGRKRVQPPGEVVRDFYQKAAKVLKYPLLGLDESARAVVAQAFEEVIRRERYTCYACAIMPDHVHMLIRKHKHKAEDWPTGSKPKTACGYGRPVTGPTITRPGAAAASGTSSSNTPTKSDARSATSNAIPSPSPSPLNSGPFVTPYDDWPLHPGHSLSSPYAKRLRAVGRL